MSGSLWTKHRNRTSWLEYSLIPVPGLAGVNLEHATFKLKDALLRKRFTDEQIEVAYHHLTRTDHDVGLNLGDGNLRRKASKHVSHPTRRPQRTGSRSSRPR